MNETRDRELLLAGKTAAALAGDAAYRVVGAVRIAPLAPGVVAEPLDHRSGLIGDDRYRAEMIGVEVARHHCLGYHLGCPHAHHGTADRQVVGPDLRVRT